MKNIMGSISVIKNFMGNAGRDTCNEYLYEALQDAIESMEMQIPSKPHVNKVDVETNYMSCPCCKITTVLYSGMQPIYCPRCGKKLDWNDDN